MYHFDHPQILEDEFGGWMDKRMVSKFEEYAEFLLKQYGSKVRSTFSYLDFENGKLTL